MKRLYRSHVASIICSLSLLLFALESSSHATLRPVDVLLTPDGEGRYSVVEIGDSLAIALRDINNHGTVVGTIGGETRQAFVWTQAEGMKFLAPHGNDLYTDARGINDKGQIVGTSSYSGDFHEQVAVLWESTERPLVLVGPASWASEVNNEGVVVGTRYLGYYRRESFMWSMSEGLQWLSTFGGASDGEAASGINNSGQIVGTSRIPDGPIHACMWTDPTEIIDLGKLIPDTGFHPPSMGINDVGQVAGWYMGTDIDRAFIWTEEDGMKELASFGDDAVASDINNAGVIVGYANIPGISPTWWQHATIWKDGEVADLNTLISSDAGYLLTLATAINDSGQIIASGYVPEPATFLMLATGTLVLRMKRRRT